METFSASWTFIFQKPYPPVLKYECELHLGTVMFLNCGTFVSDSFPLYFVFNNSDYLQPIYYFIKSEQDFTYPNLLQSTFLP